jgi:hypothetical protein
MYYFFFGWQKWRATLIKHPKILLGIKKIRMKLKNLAIFQLEHSIFFFAFYNISFQKKFFNKKILNCRSSNRSKSFLEILGENHSKLVYSVHRVRGQHRIHYPFDFLKKYKIDQICYSFIILEEFLICRQPCNMFLRMNQTETSPKKDL